MKDKWKSLKQRFDRCKLKRPKTRSGDAGGDLSSPNFEHYKQMSFLDDSPSYYPSSGNLSSIVNKYSDKTERQKNKKNEPTKRSISDDSDDEWQIGRSNNQSDGSEDSETELDPVPPKRAPMSEKPVVQNKQVAQNFTKKRPNRANLYEQVLNLENEKIKLIEKTSQERDNDDSQFLKSLLPYLDKVPVNKKLICRQEITSVILSFLPQTIEGMYSTKSIIDSSLPSFNILISNLVLAQTRFDSDEYQGSSLARRADLSLKHTPGNSFINGEYC